MSDFSDVLLLAIIIHFVCDWLLQNHWMAANKANLKHPAGYVHAGIHTIGLCLIFPAQVALFVGIVHLLIDTRKPLQWWSAVYRQTTEGIFAPHVSIWTDQVLHILLLTVVVLIWQ